MDKNQYVICFYVEMPKKYRKLKLLISFERFRLMALSKTVIFDGETYSVREVAYDDDALIAKIILDNGLREF